MKKIMSLFFILNFIFIVSSCKKKPIYERNNKTLYFGNYPQTLETDNSVILSLNKLCSNLPSSANLNGWSDYNYYINGEIKSFMYYIDIDLDNDKTFDYRGVYFTE